MKTFIIFVIIFLVRPAHAAWYQIEAVIFDRIFADAGGEIWRSKPGLPDQKNTIELITEGVESDDRLPYRALPKAKYRLQGVYQNLKLSKNYRPLMHLAWEQSTATGGKARPVRIVRLRDDSVNAAGIGSEQSEPELSPPILDGFIKLRIAHFLNVNVDLAYYPNDFLPSPPADDADDQRFNHQISHVRLQQTRRIKLNELHYFDHPMFGVILQVSRLSAEE